MSLKVFLNVVCSVCLASVAFAQGVQTGTLRGVVQDEQGLRKQTFLHLARNDDRVPVAIVVLGREDVQRENAGRKRGAGNIHQSPGRLSSGH